MKNSDYRQFANATQAESESSGLAKYLLAALVIIVPAAGIYAWKTGMFNKHRYVAVAPVQQKVASDSATPAPFSPPPQQQSNSLTGTFSSNGAVPSSTGSRPPMNPADLGKALNMALKMQMNMGLMFEMVAESMEAFGPSGAKAEVTSDRLIEYCRVQARRRLDDQGYGRNGRKASESFLFDSMAERIYCMMTRRPEKLCEPPVKAELLKQYGNYLKIRSGALSELMGSSGVEAGAPLKAGVHRAVNDELRKLAQRGYLSIDDFGWRPHEDVKMAIGDLKGVKPACKG